MNRFASLLFVFLLSTLAACGSPETETDASSSVPASSAAGSPGEGAADTSAVDTSTTYTAEGTVRSVTPSGSHVVIRHEKIPGFMDAMTMPFAVSDTVSVDHLASEDRIRFTFVVGPGGTRIQSVDVLKRP